MEQLEDDNLDFLEAILDSVENEHSEGQRPLPTTVNELKIKPAKKCIKDVNVPFLDIDTTEKASVTEKETKAENSVVHSGDTDSSDDEDNKYFEEVKYNSCGKSIKNSLKNKDSPYRDKIIPNNNYWKPKATENVEPKTFCLPKKIEKTGQTKQDIGMEPFLGIRIVNPLYSSTVLKEKMSGRTPISFFTLKNHVKHSDLKTDWVLAGVIVNQSAPKISQKGSKYVIWTLSDLKPELKTAAVFLFGKCFDKLWKTSVGTVIGILNPNVMNQNDKAKDEATLSVMNPDQIMIWGRSKDLGQCKGLKKDGQKCTSFVNLSQCEYCIYHVQREYRKYTGRGELQAATCGLSRNRLRNKVLGKDEVFYGGKSFTSLPVISNKKKKVEDVKRLCHLGAEPKTLPKPETSVLNMNSRSKDLLNMLNKNPGEPQSQFTKDNNRLKLLSKSSTNEKTTDKYCSAKKVPVLSNPELDFNEEPVSQSLVKSVRNNPKGHLQTKFNSLLAMAAENCKPSKSIPTSKGASTAEPISRCEQNDEKRIDSNLSAKSKHILEPNKTNLQNTEMSKAKLMAIEYVRKHGKFSKENQTGKNPSAVMKNLKRALEDSNEDDEPPKKQVISERFLQLMKQETKHKDLVELNKQAEEEAYFAKMEKKEQLEEKMMKTYKIDCKAVSCLKCKYTWFSASEACKEERHPLKVVDAVKRFFKCSSCGNRTVSLNIIPIIACKKCGSSSWEKTSMMKERVVKKSHELSIRGGEQTFINSVVQNGNLGLMMPDE
ncbi:protein MCM10 homolog [Cimex lectularius]|uniref:Protein MCM10 homolog n=1 Tax=Cimex lectularius TaxID=79782 RepID=A0A8I6RI58_CIMLE|nr:protein MCM10 homolog [Cimex lectularius]XP_014245892.1 protein MCM10 homolog [Cimex lectularius]XP_014245893.1 protein MCM10 homolog [Cimex lectularius]